VLQVPEQLEAADPDFVSPHRYLRFAYFDTGDYPNYIAELKKEALLTHDAWRRRSWKRIYLDPSRTQIFNWRKCALPEFVGAEEVIGRGEEI
jgi:hypothetical protein